MCTDCENLIKALNAEILCFKTKIETLKKFTDNNSEGDSVEAMNARCLELSAVIEKMIEGDKKDIQDLKLLKEKVRDVYIDGEDVLEKMDTAQRGARECYEKAASLSHAAELAETPWEKDYLNGLASASRSQGESWDRIYAFWKGQAELYDEIDSETSTLFTDGIAYHREASTMMVSFLQCGLTAPNYTKSRLRKISNRSGTKTKSTNGISKDAIYKFVHDYLINCGFTEEQIEYIYNNKYNLFSSLYAAAHWSTADCSKIIQNMRESVIDNTDNHINIDQAPDRIYDTTFDDKMKEAYVACWNALVDMGLSETHIIAVMANIFWESRFCVDNAQDSSYPGSHNAGEYKFDVNDSIGFGLIQWTIFKRKQLLQDKANELSGSVWDLNVQIECFKDEMENDPYYSKLWKSFLEKDSIEDAVEYFAEKIERAGDPKLEKRNEVAIQILDWYKVLKNE